MSCTSVRASDAFLWSSQLQQRVSVFSTGAEHLELLHASQGAIRMLQLLKELAACRGLWQSRGARALSYSLALLCLIAFSFDTSEPGRKLELPRVCVALSGDAQDGGDRCVVNLLSQ